MYLQQKVARAKWGQTLWANLNPQALLDGIDVFMKEYRKLPRPVRSAYPYLGDTSTINPFTIGRSAKRPWGKRWTPK